MTGYSAPVANLSEAGKHETLAEIKQWLAQHKLTLEQRYNIKELGIFGSYVRQEQTEDIAIDVLVEFSEMPSLLKFVNLEN